LSIKPFKRISWIVLDGMGIEHARHFTASGGAPSLARIAREGVLDPCVPSSPECQTPPALLTLFTGAEPRESGIWGYFMPDPRRPSDTISGFAAPTKGVRALWHELDERGITYSLMNVAFRNDRIWAGSCAGLRFAYDGYRTLRKSELVRVGRRGTWISCRGIELELSRSRIGVLLRKGGRTRAELLPRDWRMVQITRGLRVYACLIDDSHVLLAPLTRPLVRGTSIPPAALGDFIDFNMHRALRRLNRGRKKSEEIPVSVEMAPVEMGMRQKEALMVDAIRAGSSRLVVGYFPLVDELNHARFDLLDSPDTDDRTRDLYAACARLVDGMLSRVMAEADEDTLVVLCSDHGASAFRGSLHVNEILAQCGLVVRSATGYNFRQSAAYYHPSDSGLVVARSGSDREAALDKIRRAVDRASAELGVRIGVEQGKPGDPFIAFLHPLSDTYLTARPPRRRGESLDRTRTGGQHISPLAGTPWIQAMLGLWSPRTAALRPELDGIPTANRQVKDFLLMVLEGAR
jgi:predicted AlkP superfamily pyrophosphatase or phosphodiesterase